MAEQVGLAPAAIVASQRETHEASFALKSLDYNRQLRPRSPAMAARKVKSILKENENPDLVRNPYQAIVMARNSLKEREDASKIQGEIQKLDEEVNELKRKNEEEKLTIQDLELVLVKRRRRAEKCRRLAEAQSSYRTVLEKMIRDAMHQSVVYKEQVRLSQAASNALMARLEAQKSICDASEKELHRRYKQRDDIEKQIRPGWEQARKRSRMYDTLSEDGDNKPVLYLPGIKPRTPSHKELRVFLEEQKALEDGIALHEEEPQQEEIEEEPQKPVIDVGRKKPEEHNQSIVALEDENSIEHKLRTLEIGEGMKHNGRFPVLHESEKEEEEDEESRKQRGKGNVEKWLQMLLENTQEDLESQNIDENGTTRIDQLVRKLDSKHPHKIKILKCPVSKDKEGGVKQKLHGANKLQVLQEKDGGKKQEEIIETEASKTLAENKKASEVGIGVSSKRHEDVERMEKSGKERRIVRSESARTFRRIPSSPSMILGMRKGVDCIGKKPMVTSDDDDDGDHDQAIRNKSIQSSMKKIKKVVKI